MKIAVVADLHLNKSVYKGVPSRDNPQLPFRSVDFMDAFRFVCDQVLEMKPDLMVINGDVYDHPSPSNEVRGFFSFQLARLADAKIPVIVLIGNHDVFKKSHALEGIHKLHLKNVRVIEKPTMILFNDIRLLLMPYSMDVEQKVRTIKEEFNGFLKKIKEDDSGKQSMFFGHFAVRNAIMNEYKGKEDVDLFTNTTTTLPDKIEKKKFINRNPNDITTDDLDKIGAEYIFLGDFHRFQTLGTKKSIAMYSGSLEKTDFNEIDQKKGFIVYDSDMDTDGKMGKCKFIEYPNCRPLIDLKGNFEKIKSDFYNINHSQYQNAIVKISFIGTSEELLDFSTGLEPFKKEIREAINPMHVVSGQKISGDKQEEDASKLEIQILEKGHMEAEDVIEVVKEIINEKVEDKDERQIIIDLGVEIYKENIGHD